jgi:hypothetical protein
MATARISPMLDGHADLREVGQVTGVVSKNFRCIPSICVVAGRGFSRQPFIASSELADFIMLGNAKKAKTASSSFSNLGFALCAWRVAAVKEKWRNDSNSIHCLPFRRCGI